MNIYSKFRDYYDEVMKYGRGAMRSAISYNRQLETEVYKFDYNGEENIIKVIKLIRSLTLPFKTLSSAPLAIELLLFCGKPYILYKWDTYSDLVIYYNLKALEPKISEGDLSDYNRSFLITTTDFEADPNRYFKEEDIISIHQHFNSPIVVIKYAYWSKRHLGDIDISKDVSLRDIEFMKVMDPYTCFQEIEMFLGSGILDVGGDGKVEVSDETKIQKHGYNESSFRKTEDTRKRKQHSKKHV